MNRKSANTCLTDMINISIESFKLLLNEINQIENKNSFIIIPEDALLSKGTSNEEMASQDHHLHLCNTDLENTILLVNNSNIALLFPPQHIHGNYFCWGFAASFSLLRAFESRTLQLRWRHSLLLRGSKHRWAALDSRGMVSCCFHQHGNFFHH